MVISTGGGGNCWPATSCGKGAGDIICHSDKLLSVELPRCQTNLTEQELPVVRVGRCGFVNYYFCL